MQESLSAGRNLNMRIREAAGIFFHLKTIRFGKDFWQPVYINGHETVRYGWWQDQPHYAPWPLGPGVTNPSFGKTS